MTSRRGTETRRRSKQVGVRLTPVELAVLQQLASDQGTSPAGLLYRTFVVMYGARIAAARDDAPLPNGGAS